MTDVGSGSNLPTSPRKHVGHIHNFRGLAVLFIVATHTISIFDWSSAPTLERALKYCFANGTLFFLFISGYLFEYLSESYRAIPYWRKKLLYVVLPYVLMSLPAVFVFTTVVRRQKVRAGFYDQAGWVQALEFFGTGVHLAPFWFIPTVVMFIAASPLLVRLFRVDKAFLILPVLFAIPVFVLRGPNPALNFLHFLPIWVMGMACCRFSASAEPLLRQLVWPLAGLTIALAVAEFLLTRGTHGYLGYMQKSVMTVFLMALMLRLGDPADPLLRTWGTLSFGLFFVHSYVITAGKYLIGFLAGGQPPGNIAVWLLASAIAVAMSGLVVKLTQRLLGRNSRLVIGV